ncbi:hypothetical protein ACTHGU_15940 [Chitinophagaceae bacterium MMS25-I14]
MSKSRQPSSFRKRKGELAFLIFSIAGTLFYICFILFLVCSHVKTVKIFAQLPWLLLAVNSFFISLRQYKSAARA